MIAISLLFERWNLMLESGSLKVGLVSVQVQEHRQPLLKKVEFANFGQFDNACPVVTVLEDLADSISPNYYASLNSFKNTVASFAKSLQEGTLDRVALKNNILALLEHKQGVSVESTDNSFSIKFSSRLLEEDIVDIIADLGKICNTEVCRSWENGTKERLARKPLTDAQIHEFREARKAHNDLIQKEQDLVRKNQEFRALLRKSAEYNDNGLDFASMSHRKKPNTFISCLKGVWQSSSWTFKLFSIFPGLGIPLFIAAIIMKQSVSP